MKSREQTPSSAARSDPGQRDRQAARTARLKYVSDSGPGIRRRRRGRSFAYVNTRRQPIRNRKTLDRIQALVIPPAWEDVWICPDPQGHIQATGVDARGRKQYRYHDRWRKVRDDAKYEALLRFAQALPRIRRRVQSHLKRRGLPREKVLAAVVKLLETTLIRIGNDEYAAQNHSFGLTTMRNRHARVNGRRICFNFNGKSGVAHEIDLHEPRLARIVEKCQELPGQELFQYVDAEGEIRDVGSQDVNSYLREISGEDFTAKDFRTWAGTALAAQALREFEDFDSDAAAKRNIRQAIEHVAKRLGNTSAVCRKCYIHPAIFDAYMDHSLVSTLRQRAEQELRSPLTRFTAAEGAVLALLQRRMKRRSQVAKAGRSSARRSLPIGANRRM